VGHHGRHGTTAATMVHRVLSIYVSFVRELYVKYTFPPNKIFYFSRAIYPTGMIACGRGGGVVTSDLESHVTTCG
jgi:hypothetical protein